MWCRGRRARRVRRASPRHGGIAPRRRRARAGRFVSRVGARGDARLATRRDPSSDAATLALDDAVADVREFAFRLGLDDALAYPDELRNVYNPAAGALARTLLASAETRLATRDARGAGAILDEAATLCGAHTRDTDARTHARVALLRAHVARRVAERDGRETDAKDSSTAESAAATLAKAATWAWSSDAAHDRDTMRLCATEAASAFAARAAAEARAARAERAERAEDGGDEASGDAPDLPSHPSSSHPFLGRFAACVRAAHRVSSCRDALIDAAETSGCALEEALSSAEWPARDRDAAAEEEAARDASREKFQNADASETRRLLAAFARACARLGSDDDDDDDGVCVANVAKTHAALAASCDLYRETCCVETPPTAPAEMSDASPLPGFVATQWYEPLSAPASAWKKIRKGTGIRIVGLVYFVVRSDGRVYAGETFASVADVRAARARRERRA